MDREKTIEVLQKALDKAEIDGIIYAEVRRPIVYDIISLLKEQETELCDRCGRRRLKSTWEGHF